MLPPDYLLHVTDDVLALYEQYQTSLINDMAARLIRLGITDTTLWQLNAYQEAGGVFDDAMRRIAEITGTLQGELGQAFQEAGAKAIAFDNRVYRAAGLTPISLNQSPTMLQTLLAGLRKTGGQMTNLTATTAVTSQQAFIQGANLAYMQVVSGGMSGAQALAQQVRTFADNGLKVLYPSGRQNMLDVAMRRSMLTGVNQTCAQVQLTNMDLLGADLVETTAHMGARTGDGIANHQGWQGRWYSRSGTHPLYPNFVDITGYGQGDGLCGWGCRHGFFVVIEGVSKPNYTQDMLDEMRDATVNYDGDAVPWYDATQMQRSMERDIRKTKRELAAYQSAKNAAFGEPDVLAALDREFAKDAAKLKRQEARLKDFLGQTGLADQRERLQVYGFGRSEAQKAAWANRKFFDMGRSGGGSSAPGSLENALARNLANNPGMDDAYKKALSDRYASMTEAGRKAFDKYVSADSIADGALMKGAYYNPSTKRIHMDFAADAANPRGVGATYFHEHGHLIDFAAGKASVQYTEFLDALEKDYDSFLKNYMGTNHIMRKTKAYKDISYDLLSGDYHQTSAVSDLLEGLSKAKINGGYGHGASYWKGSGRLSVEAFAHFFEAQSSLSRNALLEEYFPRASQYFKAILEEMIK